MVRRILLCGIAVALLAAFACGANMEFDYLHTNGPGDIPLKMTVRHGIAEVLRSPESPREGQPIGLFRGPVSPGFLEALERELPSSPPTTGSGPPPGGATPVTQIRFASPKRTVSFQASSIPAPLLKRIREEADRLPAIRTIRLEFRELASDGAHIRVRVTNAGSEPVSLEGATVRAYGVQQGSRKRLGEKEFTAEASTVAPAGHLDVEIPVQFPAGGGEWLLLTEYTMPAATAAKDAAKRRVAGAASSSRTTVRLP